MATKDEVPRVRQSQELSEGEIKATRKRREKVQMCLEKLGIRCEQSGRVPEDWNKANFTPVFKQGKKKDPGKYRPVSPISGKVMEQLILEAISRHMEDKKNKVPNIVVLGSGGGLRAMIAMLGTLVELKKQNFLDAVTYLCGVSGSTWCMSLLYGNRKWSEKLMSLEEELFESLSNSSWHIAKAEESLEESIQDEHYSLTDFWAAFFVYQIVQQFDENELADHKEALETGINPYPIYAAVDNEKLSEKGGKFPGTWFEFTPHEAGYTALGAFVSTRYFGSEFEEGKLKRKKKKHICYMQGLWGSAPGNKEETIKFIRDSLANFLHLRGSFLSIAFDKNPNTFMTYQSILLLLDLQLCAVSGSDPKEVFKKLMSVLSEDEGQSESVKLCTAIRNSWAKKTREERMASCAELGKQIEKDFGGSVWNILKMVYKTVQCVLSWKWGTIHNFLYKCPNIKPSYLVENETISLVDAGLAINSAYPLVLRAQRQTDLIISFDFSDGDPFETIKKTASYCRENRIPFPNIEDQKMDENNPSDCYIFRGDNSCPTVMHFPLFNNVNCSGKVADYRKRFATWHMSFPREAIKDLLKKAQLNVSNNRVKIQNEIRRLVLSSCTKKSQK